MVDWQALEGIGGVATAVALVIAVLQLAFVFETAGAMVYDGVLPLHFVDRIMGGITRFSWRRAAAYTRSERERMGSPSAGEWWQWLVERMDEDPAPSRKEGAHVAFRDWRAKGTN